MLAHLALAIAVGAPGASAAPALAAAPAMPPPSIAAPSPSSVPPGPPPPSGDWFEPAPIVEEGSLRVSDLHTLHYELAGSRDGEPVFILHGGPGGGVYPSLRRYHDPSKWLLVLHDQRGSGKSTPFSETRQNTTADLVADIERLRRHLGFERIALFGGSWGATLALAYAERHPERVSSMVLRGVFTCRRREVDHFYHGGVEPFFPEAYAALREAIPRPERRDWPRQLLDLIERGDVASRDRAVRAWALYETRISAVGMTDAEAVKELEGWDPLAFSRIENHYMANACFLREGQLIRDLARVSHVPTVIVQGRYDVICPPVTAWEVHRGIEASRLVLVEDAGHAGGAPPLRRALVEAARSLEPKPLEPSPPASGASPATTPRPAIRPGASAGAPSAN
jgi:proline iminopeptidase